MEAEQSRSMALMAAMKLSHEAGRTRSMSAAKARIGKAAKFIGAQSVQLHGGMGMTEEYVIGHYYKRLTMIESRVGNVDYHLKRFAALAD